MRGPRLHATRYANDPPVNALCELVVDVTRRGLARVGGLDAVWTTGAFATGDACGTTVRGAPLLLSDLELVVVTRRPTRQVFRELGAVNTAVTRACAPHGFASRLDPTVLTPRDVERDGPVVLRHDLAEHGRALLPDNGRLVDLAARLDRLPLPREAARLVILDAMARQLRSLDAIASADPRRRMIVRSRFAEAYRANERALRTAWGASPKATFRHSALDDQHEAAERWTAFRRAPRRPGGPASALLFEWFGVVAHQLDTLAVIESMPRPDARPLRALRDRLHRTPTPLEDVYARIRASIEALLAGPNDVRAWSKQAVRDLGAWRTLRHGGNDLPPAFGAVVTNALRRIGREFPAPRETSR